MLTKRILISMIIIAVLAIGAYSLYPLPLEDVISINDDLYVVHTISSIDDGEPLMDTTEYSYKKESDEIRRIEEVLSKYTYHRGLRIFSYDNDIEISEAGIFIQIISKNNSFSSGGSGEVMIDSKIYKMDYWGNRKNNQLIEDLSRILN